MSKALHAVSVRMAVNGEAQNRLTACSILAKIISNLKTEGHTYLDKQQGQLEAR